MRLAGGPGVRLAGAWSEASGGGGWSKASGGPGSEASRGL